MYLLVSHLSVEWHFADVKLINEGPLIVFVGQDSALLKYTSSMQADEVCETGYHPCNYQTDVEF